MNEQLKNKVEHFFYEALQARSAAYHYRRSAVAWQQAIQRTLGKSSRSFKTLDEISCRYREIVRRQKALDDAEQSILRKRILQEIEELVKKDGES